MPRSPARRRPLPRYRDAACGGRFRVFRGPLVKDAVSGFNVPLQDTVAQRGGRVSRRWSDGTRDRSDDY